MFGIPTPPFIVGSRSDAISTRSGIPFGYRLGPNGKTYAPTMPSAPLPNSSSIFSSILKAIDSTCGEESGEFLKAVRLLLTL
jgi:hypothetical protein